MARSHTVGILATTFAAMVLTACSEKDPNAKPGATPPAAAPPAAGAPAATDAAVIGMWVFDEPAAEALAIEGTKVSAKAGNMDYGQAEIEAMAKVRMGMVDHSLNVDFDANHIAWIRKGTGAPEQSKWSLHNGNVQFDIMGIGFANFKLAGNTMQLEIDQNGSYPPLAFKRK